MCRDVASTRKWYERPLLCRLGIHKGGTGFPCHGYGLRWRKCRRCGYFWYSRDRSTR